VSSNLRNRGEARRRGGAGFTLIEMMVVLAIVAIGAALVLWGFGAQGAREKLRLSTLELRGLFSQARQTAYTTGNRVVVMVFPEQVTNFAGARGRIIVYEDGDFDLFSGAGAVSFDTYNPGGTAAGPRSQVVDTMDLPTQVAIGPADGWGGGARAQAPFDSVALDKGCAFCTGAGSRGAVVFEPLGDVTFYDRNGVPLALDGAALSLTADDTREVRTLVIARNGMMRSLFTAR
jgi:prepilin-type N-terminal cleavage/methylation domain-containing protein